MTEPPSFEDLEPETPTGGVRRWIVIGVVALLVVSMVFLAWVSGRGEVVVVPVTPAPSSAAAGPSPTATAPSPAASVAATSAPAATPGSGQATARLAVVEADKLEQFHRLRAPLFLLAAHGRPADRHAQQVR